MALIPITGLYYHNEAPLSSLFQHLLFAHERGLDHAQLIHALELFLRGEMHLTESRTSAICKYLRLNLTENIQLVTTIGCLPLVHQHASVSFQKHITSVLREKYPSHICFYVQIQSLSYVNLNLIESFLQIVRSLFQWILLQVEAKEFKHLQRYELEYAVNCLYAEERYKFQENLDIQGTMSKEAVLSIYRMTLSDLDLEAKFKSKIIHALFYFLCNIDLDLGQGQEHRHVFNAIGDTLNRLQPTLASHEEMVKFLMPKVRLLVMKATKTRSQLQEMLVFLKNTIINVFLCCWTIEIQYFWLWKFKLICDLLCVDEKQQRERMGEIRVLFKEISKLINY